MESDASAPALLRHVERAAAAPYIDYPRTPTWFAPTAGLWAAAMVLAVATLGHSRLLGAVSLVVLVAAEGAFFAWYRRYSQTMPSMQSAPPEISIAYRLYAAGVVLIIGLCAMAYVIAGPFVCALATFVLVSVGLILYERRYATAAAATRRRLGPPR